MVKWNFRNLFIQISFTFSELEGIKVIIDKSLGEVSLMEQDTIEIHIFLIHTSKCATNCVVSFEVYDGFIGQKILKL